MSAPDSARPGLDDPRVIAALDEYLAALEAGNRLNREAFLSCHADVADALAECLEGMEALHEASSSGSAPQPLGTAVDWQPGTPLGDYRILREVGRGGMGVVYEAEQLSLDRRIALKVLPFALTLDPRQLQRFKNEARAAAQLHHQNIVPVHAVGCERGVHFYAMQYIEGQSLADLIAGLRQLPRPGKASATFTGGRVRPGTLPGASTGPFVEHAQGTAGETASEPVGALATAYSKNATQFYRAVARLGIQAAEALEHAHQYGVVHRDIKPANLLVDAHGHLWVTDFGLAQFQTDAGLTQTGDLLGTLRYMSPEQAGGQRGLIDHRTDVYSLGATLYELLTLRPPFDGADRQTLLRQILHDEPRPPRAVEKSIPAELETIVLKALAKTPAERYATARELADDLSRFLGHQPIRARRATALQRLRKWSRRHPSVVVATVVLCVLTTVGSLVSVGLIRREEARTQAAYQGERKRAQEAEERFLLAKAWVDETFNVCEEELAGQPHLDGVRRRLLEHALAYYQKLIEQRGDTPDGQVGLVGNRERVQHILDDLVVLQGDRKLPLLAEPAVLDDLGLAGERRDQIAELQRLRGKQFRELFGKQLPEEDKRRAFLAVARSSEAFIEKVLTRDQLARLRQIELQRQGSRAFEDTEVTVTLRLTAGQRERIRTIQAKAFFSGLHDHGRPKPGKPPEPPSLAVVAEILATVLTAEQVRQWQKLIGEPFKGPLPGPPPRPGDPLPGPGGQPGRGGPPR
jgi:serine/threonine protein kinase